MKLPDWMKRKTERRTSSGGLSDQVLRIAEAQAAGSAATIGATAAVESAAGSLARALASAKVVTDSEHVRRVVTPAYLADVGRQLIVSGESLHVIDVDAGELALLPVASWHWTNTAADARPASWKCRATWYGPSTSTTKLVPFDGLVFHKWASSPGTPYVGSGPLSWSYETARLAAENEKTLADEMSGPIAQLLVTTDNGAQATGDEDDDEDTDPNRDAKMAIRGARGDGVIVETTSAGHGDGTAAAPRRDWEPMRLGPAPPETLALLRRDSFNMMLAACGSSAALHGDADGTAQREAFRRYLTLTIQPIAKLIAAELSLKLEADISFDFDALYASDLQGRATAFKRLVDGGMELTQAAAVSGVLLGDE